MTDVKRYVVQARFLGLDNNTTKGGKVNWINKMCAGDNSS